MTIRRVHHIQIKIHVGAEEPGRAFYCGVLGLREIEKAASLKHRGGFWVMVADQQLHVGVEDGIDRGASKAHVAYEVDDMVAWRKRLASARVAIAESIPIPGYDRLEFRDPFGNRIELIQPRPPQ